MTDCRSVRELLGGYALGALEPEEAERVREHLAGCPDCAREGGSLVEAASLLELVEATDAPLTSPSPELEERLLDSHARERRSPAVRVPRPRRVLLGGALAAGAVAAIAAIAVIVAGSGHHSPSPTAKGDVRLSAPAGSPGAGGRAELRSVSAGTAVRLSVKGLDPGPGAVYTLWCVRDDGRWVSAGSFRPNRGGQAAASLTAAVRRGEYGRVLVTRSRPGAAARHGRTVLVGAVDYE